MVLIWRLIGWPCLIGVLSVLVAQGINAIMTRILLHWERKRRTATDSKLQKSTQFVSAIRHLRWYGWQDFWQEQILEARQHELHLRVITSLLRTAINFMNALASDMFPVIAFYAYTALAGQPLRIEIAFPALQLFGLLESSLREIPGLVTVLLNAKIAVDRIEDFMREPDKDDPSDSTASQGQLVLQDASFAWPGAPINVLHGINLTFSSGLTLIGGKVAAGKTALLQALLGELDLRAGQIFRPDEMTGYCAQAPWLQSMSIRENILFSSPYDKSRYDEVLEACALMPDLSQLKDNDLSEIGENGIGLSGGQKARVALARAVYSRARVLLLDDPLSALDHQTAETIVRKCFGGPLLEARTVILVTHRVELCDELAWQIVEVDEGKARVIDREKAASTSNDLGKVLSNDSANNTDRKQDVEADTATVPEKFMEDEHRAYGGVKASVYWEYIKAGKLKWWTLMVCIVVVYRLLAVAQTWFLKEWGEAYNERSESIASGLFATFPSPETDVYPWLLWYFILAAANSIALVADLTVELVIIYSSGRQMFKDIFNRVTHATFRFYDVTPVGRLMNRLTSDIGTIDGGIGSQLQDITWLSIAWISSIVVIASVTPIFLVFTIILSAAFVLVFLRFLPTSQSLRRLEVRCPLLEIDSSADDRNWNQMASLSPLMSNFGALLDGLTTVRGKYQR